MLPSPSEIIGFLEIVKTQNITKAALRLGLTQSSLSQSLKRLEDCVGEQLVIRSKSGVVLTRGGKLFYERAYKILALWDDLKSGMHQELKEVRGHIKLGVHSAVASYTLAHFIPNLMTHYVALEIDLIHGLSRSITHGIINYEIDIGLVINPYRHPDLVIIPLLEDSVSLWRVAYHIQKEIPSVLICDPSLLQTEALLQLLKRENISFERTLSSNSLEIITHLTMSGCGYGILPKRVVGVSSQGSKLTPLYEKVFLKDRLCLVYRQENRQIEAIKIIKDLIIEKMKSED